MILNACLTCDNFLTTVEFLPADREQLQRTEELIASAHTSGAQRLVEMNEPVRVNLIRIIEGVDALPTVGSIMASRPRWGAPAGNALERPRDASVAKPRAHWDSTVRACAGYRVRIGSCRGRG